MTIRWRERFRSLARLLSLGARGRDDPRPFEPPPDDEDALVGVGGPRRRPPSAAVALEPPVDPDPLEYPIETDAAGSDEDHTL